MLFPSEFLLISMFTGFEIYNKATEAEEKHVIWIITTKNIMKYILHPWRFKMMRISTALLNYMFNK